MNENIASASSQKEVAALSSEVAPSPDNKAWIAYGKDGNVWLIAPDGSQQAQVTYDGNNTDKGYGHLKWSPDGKFLAFTGPNNHLYIYDIDNNELDDAEFENKWWSEFSWSPDGKEIIYSKLSGDDILVSDMFKGFWLYDIADKENTILLKPPPNTYLTNPGWSPKGSYLGFDLNISAPMADKQQFQIAKTNQPEAFLPFGSIEPMFGNHCTWAPSEDKLACNNTVLWRDGCIINIMDLSGNILNKFAITGGGCNTEPLWSPDGEYIAIGSNSHAFSLYSEVVLIDLNDRSQNI